MPDLSQVVWRVCPALTYAHICNPSMRPFEPCRGVLSAFCLLFRSNLRVQVNFEETGATLGHFRLSLFDTLTSSHRILCYAILSLPQSLGSCSLVGRCFTNFSAEHPWVTPIRATALPWPQCYSMRVSRSQVPSCPTAPPTTCQRRTGVCSVPTPARPMFAIPSHRTC